MSHKTDSPPRIASVDVLRGLSMAAMIVVNNPGTWSAMYAPLRHAAWGRPLSPADLIFPMFIFLVGVSTPLALARRLDVGVSRAAILRQASNRSAVLFLIGLGLNVFPDFQLSTLRIPGVLQRIAIVYLACVIAYLYVRPRIRLVIAAAILAGYTALLTWVPVPGAGQASITPELSLPVWLDDTLLGSHTWRGPGDPEGILSTLPAIASGLIGMFAGTLLQRGRTPGSTSRLLAALGLGLAAAGHLWSPALPAVKELWTAPYVLITGGWSLLALAAGVRLVDDLGWRRGLAPLTALGRHALGAFAAAHLISDITIRVIRWSDGAGGSISLHHFVQRHLLASWLPAEAASLAQSLGLLVLIVTPLVLLRRRRG